jgi:hypothetical protein
MGGAIAPPIHIMATDIDIINKWLKNQYGTDLRSRPWYRIIWSENETEKRTGIFNDFTDSGLYIGYHQGLREVKKYANPIYKDRWILEKLIYGLNNKEIWGDTARDGIYEPIWVFRGPGDTYQKPTTKTVDFIVQSLLAEKPKLTQSDTDYEEEQSLEKEKREEYERLGGSEDRPLMDGQGIVVPKNYGG